MRSPGGQRHDGCVAGDGTVPTVNAAPAAAFRSKTLATWIALAGGSLGLHRFYLHGWRDAWGWLHLPVFALGAWGVQRALERGQDDELSWLLIPLLGLLISAAMLTAIVHGLTPDERWNARYNDAARPCHSGWAAVTGVVLALFVGSGVLMATLAFSAQRFFEWQAGQPPAAAARSQGSSSLPTR